MRKGCFLRVVPVNDKREPRERADKVLQWLAHISQIGMLVLGVIGYIYTIKPVFEKHLLEEQISELKSEKTAASLQVAILGKQEARLKEDIHALQENWKQEQARNNQLSNNLSQLKNSLILARGQADKAKSELKNLDVTRWNLLTKELILFFYSTEHNIFNTPLNYTNVVNVWDDIYKPEGFILAAKKAWPKPPYDQILSSIDVLSKVHDGEQRDDFEPYLAKLRAFVITNKSALQCDEPNFNALNDKFTLEIASLKPSIDSELDRRVSEIRNKYTMTGQNVELSQEFLLETRKNIQATKVFILVEPIQDLFYSAQNECQNKVWKFFEKISAM